jgi:biopolymer transport protein ExbD
MARRTSIRPLQELNEINMTPLIDLTFLLLITFIITMPMVEQGIPVNLPKGKSATWTRAKPVPSPSTVRAVFSWTSPSSPSSNWARR